MVKKMVKVKKPAGVFYFDIFFHYDRIIIFGPKCLCFTNLSLYLCIKVVLSILYHKKGDMILSNSGEAKKKLVAVCIFILGFYGTYLVYNHQDVLLGPYSDVTFKLKSLMHKGLQPAMNDSVIEMEAENLVKDFELTAGCDVDPQDIVRDAFGNLTAFLVSQNCYT